MNFVIDVIALSIMDKYAHFLWHRFIYWWKVKKVCIVHKIIYILVNKIVKKWNKYITCNFSISVIFVLSYSVFDTFIKRHIWYIYIWYDQGVSKKVKYTEETRQKYTIPMYSNKSVLNNYKRLILYHRLAIIRTNLKKTMLNI